MRKSGRERNFRNILPISLGLVKNTSMRGVAPVIQVDLMDGSLGGVPINSTDQDKCQGIDTVLKDVDEVGGDDANAAQLGIDGGHEDAEHSSSVQLLQSCK